MAAPLIVSLWERPEKQGFLCSGLLLTGKHILTVRHAFEGWPEADPVYVRLIDGVDGDIEARVFQRHRERDAAILELQTAVGPIASPELLTRSDRTYDGQPATLRVIDPDSFGRSIPTNYSIANFDHATGEFVITPENARGHSGGVVEVDDRVIGLLSRRTRTDPLCRAVAMHLLWPWIEASIGSSQGSPEPDGSLLVGTVSPAYRTLVDKIRQRVRRRLAKPALAALAAAWGSDPVADLDLSLSAEERSKRIKGLLHGLHRKTRECRDEWQSLPTDRLAGLKDDCRFLLSESIKLTVDPQASESELGPVSAAALAPVHLLCNHGGTADVVLCALADLDHLLEKREDGLDIAADITVHFDDLLPSGEGEARRQELLQKLWKKTMNARSPGRVEGKYYEQLLAKITLDLERDERRYVLAAPGWRDWCAKSEYRKWADDLKLGLVLHEPGGCRYLLIEEAMVIEIVRDYLQLLETL